VTRPTEWAGHAAALLLSLGLAGVAREALRERSPCRVWLLGYEHRLDRDLGFVRAGFRGRAVLSAQITAIVCVLGVAFYCSSVAPLVVTVPIGVGPALAARRARLMRTQALEGQLDVWVLALANALSVTASLGDAIATSAGLIQPPMQEEVETVLREFHLGIPLDEALSAMGKRIESRVIEGALLTLSIARSAGGNARATLETAAATLREMARLEGVVRAKTAEGKAQALVVSVIPAPLVVAVRMMAPEFFAPFSQSRAGMLVALLAVALWGAAIALAAKICAVDV
jgi:tight adherence protein B